MTDRQDPSALATLLPEGIRRWLPPSLDRPKKAESHASCGDCVMLGDKGDAPVTFRPETKCCTYHPWLPNFLVGGLLCDPDHELDEGRNRILSKMATKEGVNPAGIFPPRLSRHLYRIGKNVFGRASTLRCPYYDPESEAGNCTVWRYREAVCATWFCKHTEGADGFFFWRELRNYLKEVEQALVIHSLLELGFEGGLIRSWFDEPEVVSSEDIDHRPPDERLYHDMWGSWRDRELELYRETWRIAIAVGPERLEELLGAKGRACLDAVERAADELERRMPPDPLALGTDLEWVFLESGGAIVAAYSGYDPVRLAPQLVEPLRLFNGARSNDEALGLMERRHGVRLSSQLLLALYRQRILVDPSRPERRTIVP